MMQTRDFYPLPGVLIRWHQRRPWKFFDFGEMHCYGERYQVLRIGRLQIIIKLG